MVPPQFPLQPIAKPLPQNLPNSTTLSLHEIQPNQNQPVATENLASNNAVQFLVGYKVGKEIVALGVRCLDRKKLHGTDIPKGYERIQVKWVKRTNIRAALLLGDPEENRYLSIGQFFALLHIVFYSYV